MQVCAGKAALWMEGGKRMTVTAGEKEKEQMAMELTSLMLHKHYCENDVEALIALLDDAVHWFGAGEYEYAVGIETVAPIFRRFAGQVPKCNISDEEYDVVQIAPETYLCTGRIWVATDASTQISLRVHQRVTMVFRWRDGQPRCCHIHISNPYQEMIKGDQGFPVKMAQESYRYLQEQIEKQKEQIRDQTAMLLRMSYEDSLTGVYNRNKFNEIMEPDWSKTKSRLGVAYFDLNGLKAINDSQGHSVGDQFLCRAAEQLWSVFEKKTYRTGGDEFIVVDDTLEEAAFQAAVRTVLRKMEQVGIRCAVGISWRTEPCSVKEQLEEADQRMYQEKRRFYSVEGNDRRNRREGGRKENVSNRI